MVIFLKLLVLCFCIINHHFENLIIFYSVFQFLQVGDPLEKAALKGIDWSYKSDEKALPRK